MKNSCYRHEGCIFIKLWKELPAKDSFWRTCQYYNLSDIFQSNMIPIHSLKIYILFFYFQRLDGRNYDESRNLSIDFGSEYGSCIVSLGETK